MRPYIFSWTTIVKPFTEFTDLIAMAELTELPAPCKGPNTSFFSFYSLYLVTDSRNINFTKRIMDPWIFENCHKINLQEIAGVITVNHFKFPSRVSSLLTENPVSSYIFASF